MPHREKGKRKKKQIAPASGGGIRLRGRIWIDGPSDTFLGYGRMVLMERIREYGSISKAAKSMDISYRHAWELVDSMNSQSSHPFVTTSTGGQGGGGAVVTEHGEKALSLFWDIYRKFQDFLKGKEAEFKQLSKREKKT